MKYCPAYLFPWMPSSPALISDKQGKVSLLHKALTLLHLPDNSVTVKDYASGKDSPLIPWGISTANSLFPCHCLQHSSWINLLQKEQWSNELNVSSN